MISDLNRSMTNKAKTQTDKVLKLVEIEKGLVIYV